MKFINELYCGKGTDPQNSGSDTKVAAYNGCVYAAEQVPVKAGLFALGALILGAVVGRFMPRGKPARGMGLLPKRSGAGSRRKRK